MKQLLLNTLILNIALIKLSYGSNKIYTEFALDYFKTREPQIIIMYLCWPVEDRLYMMKLFAKSGIRVSMPLGKYYNDDVKSLKKIFRNDGNQLGVVFDTGCYNSSFPTYQKYTFFNASYIWLVFDNNKFDEAIQYGKRLPLMITTDMVIVKTITLNDSLSLELHDVYNPGFDKGGILNATLFGTWKADNETSNKPWKELLIEPKVQRRYDLNGLTIKAVTFTEHRDHNDPLERYLVDEHFTNVDSVFKMNYHLILLLQEQYNFTISLIMADNWSDKNSIGLYRSGNLLGILADKKADIMAAALQLMNDRLAIADVLQMTYPFRAGFIFRYSGDFGQVRLNFLTPFVDNVWYILVTISVVITLVIWLFFVLEKKYLAKEIQFFWDFGDAVLSVLTAWCQMGSSIRPLTNATRLVYLTMFLNSLIIYNFYTSSIVSSLLSYRSRTFSIIDLANSPMQCGSVDTGYVHNLLFDIPVYPNMAYFNSKKKRKDFYYSIEDGLKHVKKGGFAFHAEFSNLYNTIENNFEATEICELQEVDTVPLIGLGILAQKHSPYSEMFKVGLTRTRETGQVKRLLEKWVSRKPICQTSKGVSGVNILQIASNFFVLLIGYGISILIFVNEYRLGNNKQIKKAKQKIKKLKKCLCVCSKK